MNLNEMTVVKTAEAVNNQEISARYLIERTLEQIKNNVKLNAFACTAGAEAFEQADAVDQKIKSGYSLPLAGIPLAVGDNIAYKELPTAYGSAAFRKFKPPFSAAAVEKLIGAGAVVVGKINTGDMGFSSHKALSPAGPVMNPWKENRISESPGSAALAARQCMLALESDSEGSLRQGASSCGMYGFRPTPGRVSRYGLNLSSGSYDQVGFAASTATDMGITFQATSGYDERDILTSVSREAGPKPDPNKAPGEITLAFSPECFDQLDSISAKHLKQFQAKCLDLGFKVVESSLKLLPEALKAFYIIAYAEASSSFARFDGIRFGTAAEADELEDLYYKTRKLTFGHEARRRSVFGTYILSKGNFEQYYQQALKVWTLVRQDFNNAMANCDFLVMPVVSGAAPSGIEENDFLQRIESDIFTAPVSMACLPSLALPAWQEDGLPAGIQLVGHPFSDEILLNVAEMINTETIFPDTDKSAWEEG